MSETIPPTPSAIHPAKKKQRSPSYPSLTLEESIKLAKILWDKEKRHPAPVAVVVVHWNFGARSSTGLLAISALKKFGLLSDEGSGSKRTVKLTDFALEVIKHEESPEELGKLLKVAALRPQIHRDLWLNHRDASDANIKRVLIFDKKFNDAVVDGLIKEYRDTVAFAKLQADDIIPENPTENDEEEDQESAGQNLAIPLKPPAGNLSTQTGKPAVPPMNPAIRYLPIPLDIGDAPIPVGMSEDDFQLLLDTLQLWKKKIVTLPRHAIWHSEHGDINIEIVKYLKDEEKYLISDGRTVPEGLVSYCGASIRG